MNKVYSKRFDMIVIQDRQSAQALNTLAREQLKHKILADINMDLMICKIEGWDIKEHISNIKEMLDDIAKSI
jgi:hypothetical protein